MAVPPSELNFVLRGPDLVCIAAPVGHPLDGELAIEIARIKMKMLADKETVENWVDIVKALYVDSVSRCFDVDPEDFKWADATPNGTRQ